jgi:hypothetical protein
MVHLECGGVWSRATLAGATANTVSTSQSYVSNGLADVADGVAEDESVDFVADLFWEGHESGTALVGVD